MVGLVKFPLIFKIDSMLDHIKRKSLLETVLLLYFGIKTQIKSARSFLDLFLFLKCR
jgi:hypothetical protein